jgi:hypothetical protein
LVRSATHREQRKKEPIIDWKKMWQGFATPVVGVLLAIVFLNSVGYNAFIIGTQSYTVDTLRMTPKHLRLCKAFLFFFPAHTLSSSISRGYTFVTSSLM